MSGLSHLDEAGAARMVDVSAKPVTARAATASGRIVAASAAIAAARDGSAPKGDVIAAARIAGIMAAKRTAELIPLCHPLPLASVEIAFDLADDAVTVTATARTTAQTGVEMEAMTAATVALLTLYDMLKSVDKGMTIDDIRLLSKTGGKSGDWTRG